QLTLLAGPITTVPQAHSALFPYTTLVRSSNQATSSATSSAKVDTSAPSIPAIVLAESSSIEFVSGSTLYYNPQGSNSDSFDVSATSSDAQSGVASIAFPTDFGSDSLTDTTSPYGQTYSWDASASASGAKTVTVTNGAGL